MLIRDITLEDEALYYDMSLDFYDGDATLFPMTSTKLKATFEAAINGSPFLRLVMIEKDQKVVGYGLLAFYWSNESGGMVTQLEEFYIHPSTRGAGLGGQFLDWLFDIYKSQTARFRLEVCPSNPSALRLYEHYGFTRLDYIQMIKSY